MRNFIDMHCDTISELMKNERKETLKQNHLCIDIEGMEKAGTLLQFFACFVHVPKGDWDAQYHKVSRMIHRMKEEQTDMLRIIRSYKEFIKNEQKNKISALLTLEEGGVLNGKMERLAKLYRKQIRLITLTWNYENCMGYPNSTDSKIMEKGLKPFGREVVERMNELGMIVDVSHLSDGGFRDCIKISKKPIVASHSNARALCPHPRNLTDEMLCALAENGGVAGLNFYPRFLRNGEQAEIQDIARHAKYMIQTAGEDIAAIGTDFDGFEVEEGIQWISKVEEMEIIWECMKREGITERQIDKIMSGNARRVLQEVL